MSETSLSGRVWVLADSRGRLIEDIDTDQIFHNAHLHITRVEEMGRFALGNLEGWKDFSGKAEPGDFILAGRNFGAGSSRQQAVDCFIALETGLLIAASFGAIYFRNAVNAGFPVLAYPELDRRAASGDIRTGDRLQIDILTGRGRNMTRNREFAIDPMSRVQFDIWKAGGLFAYARERKRG